MTGNGSVSRPANGSSYTSDNVPLMGRVMDQLIDRVMNQVMDR